MLHLLMFLTGRKGSSSVGEPACYSRYGSITTSSSTAYTRYLSKCGYRYDPGSYAKIQTIDLNATCLYTEFDCVFVKLILKGCSTVCSHSYSSKYSPILFEIEIYIIYFLHFLPADNVVVGNKAVEYSITVGTR